MAASATPTPPKPEFSDCDETTISCQWTPDATTSYRLEYKEYPDRWEDCFFIDVAMGQGSASTTKIEDLNPTSTYTLRLIAIKDGVESAPSEELIVDTQAAKCTPEPENPSKCVVS